MAAHLLLTTGGGWLLFAASGGALDWTTSTDTEQEVRSSGGYWGRRPRTREEIEDERRRLGIIPAPVAKVVSRAAKRALVAARKEVERQDTTDYLAALEREIQSAISEQSDKMRRSIEAQQLEWHLAYKVALKNEIDRLIQEQEEHEIVLLLLDL